MSHSELRLPSAKLRRKLGLVKATLGTIVKEVRSLELEQKVVEADDPVEDKIDKCEKRRNFIKSLTAKLDSNVNRVDSIVREWEDIIENSENSELVRDHEEALLGEMYAGKGSVIALAEEARTMVMDLKGYEEKMEKLLEELFSSKEKQTSIKNESGSVSNPAIFQWQLQVGALTVPTFDPEKDVFEVFWELFEETVDKVTDYTNIQKIFLLKRSLVGEAKELISTILPRAENYQIMIDTLKENYGMKEDSLDKLIEELIDRNPAKDWRQTIKTAKEIRIWINKGKLKGMDVDHPVITFIVKRKLPQKVVRRILETKPVKHSWTATQILDTIREMEKRENEIPSKETKFTTESSLSKQPKLELQKERETSAFHLQRKEKEPKKVSRSCIFCGEDHWNDECLKFKTKREREAIIKNKGLCMKCFHKDHKEGECQVKLKCYHCGRGHNRALCNQRRDYSREKEEAVTVTASRKRDSTILMAREVTIRNPKNPRKRLTVLALFDSGSTDNYVREEITERLDLEHSTSCLLKVTGFNERENEIRSKRVQLQLETINQKTVNFEAYTTTTLVKPVRIVDTSTVAEWQDQSTQGYQPKLRKKKPDLILGINILQALSHPEETKRLETGFMWLPTEVGPILSTYDRSMYKELNLTREEPSLCLAISKEEELRTSLEFMWALEPMGINEDPGKKGDEEALLAFQNSIERENGRYIVGWPWKCDNPRLEKNYGLAVGRLNSLLKRLKADAILFKAYEENILGMLKANIIEEVQSTVEETNLVSYLPHHPVLTPLKPTTKLRIVFDASASSRKGGSLNENLYRGPVLLPQLVGILLRSRLYRFIIIADVEKAFLQIGLREKDRDVTRFLWIKTKNGGTEEDNLRTYRFTRIPFGAVSSPFLLGAVIQYHLKHFHQNEAEDILRNLYVDNVVLVANTEEEALEKRNSAERIFREATMNLREFISNSALVNGQRLPQQRLQSTKILGMSWEPESDILQITTKPTNELKSKREVLKFMASNFDPLGWIAPSILPWKILIQKMWKEKLKWDDELTPTLKKEIEKANKTWKKVSFQIPRTIVGSKRNLHVFTDASNHAYAAVAYLRDDNDIQAEPQLFFVKIKLTPIKELTIPRMELLGVTIGVRLVKFISKEIQIDEIIIWSDSTTVLSWIKQPPVTSRFITNRLLEITTIPNVTFRYVPTKQNPADIASRGCTLKQLQTNPFWWKGPQWLEKRAVEWPKWPINDNISTEGLEEHIERQCLTAQDVKQEKITIIERWPSSWEKLLKIIVKVLLWIKRISTRAGIKVTKVKELPAIETGEYYRMARTLAYKIGQSHGITQEDINKWDLRRDEHGLYRCYGRLQKLNNTSQPVFLPYRSPVSSLLIESVHQKCFHGSQTLTLANLRQVVWIPKARKLARSIITRCTKCNWWKKDTFVLPPFPPLPKERVVMTRSFLHTGVDYFGPLKIYEDRKMVKRWVAFFTCMCTRAIHLEIAKDLTAESFLNVFRRFVSRRGRPEILISDNAKNFLLSKATLSKINKETNQQEVVWKNITPKAPWEGGFYERLIGVTKKALRQAIGKKTMDQEQLHTLLCEVEAVVNSRPITYMDTDSLEYLRPVDFLVPRAILTIDPNHEKEDKQEDDTRSAEQLRKRWQATQRCIKSFWNHWRKGYIGNLRERYQLKHKRSRSQVDRKPELGEIIIVKEEQQPRALWKLARVVEVPSEGTVRHVKIKTGNGKVLIRPINLLCPLEIRDATTKASAHANSRELPEQIEISEAGETDPLSFSGMS